jgi:hypothetical protein
VVTRLAGIVDGTVAPGLYRWRSRAHPAAIRRELAGAHIGCHVLDGARVFDTASLVDRCAVVLQFPGRFTTDWDGFAAALADLSWLTCPIHVLIWEHYGMLARHDAGAWNRARDLLVGSTTSSGTDGPALYVLLRGPGPPGDVPVL